MQWPAPRNFDAGFMLPIRSIGRAIRFSRAVEIMHRLAAQTNATAGPKRGTRVRSLIDPCEFRIGPTDCGYRDRLVKVARQVRHQGDRLSRQA